MYQKINSTNSQLDRVMSEEQFNQIVEAIVSGKYSWACLLILRFSGYNPLHYIPYRTYNRLMKVHREQIQVAAKDNKIVRPQKSNSTQSGQKSTKLRDLCYLEDTDRQSTLIKGGKAFSFQTMSNMILDKFRNS